MERLGDPVEGAESRIAQGQTSWSLALLSDFFRPGTQVLRVTPDAFTAQKTFPRFNLSFPTLGLVTLCLRDLYLNPVLSAS